ncbi:hypothetical protein [Nocardia gipuzkoensis]|uniref:hypothetical protein n=1 Tax=Nocardia gipuzkoensis TaxID=2749991 RepID=UPI00237D9F8C|nr:hypothetical protein [Nocardia gipuzkoensis]MDE1674283.1 hypothetical protein [Nocardia gipuzkoensis]
MSTSHSTPETGQLAPETYAFDSDGITQRYHVYGRGPVCLAHPGGPGMHPSAYDRRRNSHRSAPGTVTTVPASGGVQVKSSARWTFSGAVPMLSETHKLAG